MNSSRRYRKAIRSGSLTPLLTPTSHKHSALTFAAMDTTSNSLSRILHILSENPEAQQKLREEIRAAQAEYGSDELDYDALNAMPYLDAVCRETLRL